MITPGGLPGQARAPRVGVLFLTPSCNMACGFCGSEADFEVLPYDSALNWIAQFKAKGGESVVLGGGEPLLWPHDLAALAGQARAMGLLTQLGSNATHAGQRSELLRSFDRWVLPLDAERPQAHDRLRSYPGGHFKLVIDQLERLREAQVEVSISSIVTAQNFDELLGLGRRLRHYVQGGGRLHAWHFYRFLPQGRAGARNARHYEISLPAFSELGSLIRNSFSDLPVLLRPDMYHSKEVGFYWKTTQGWQCQEPN